MRLNQIETRTMIQQTLASNVRDVRHLPWDVDGKELHRYLLTFAEINALGEFDQYYQNIPLSKWCIFEPLLCFIIPSKVYVVERQNSANLINGKKYEMSDSSYRYIETVETLQTVDVPKDPSDPSKGTRQQTNKVIKRVHSPITVMDFVEVEQFNNRLSNTFHKPATSFKPVTDARMPVAHATVVEREINMDGKVLSEDIYGLYLNTLSFYNHSYVFHEEFAAKMKFNHDMKAFGDSK